MCNSFGLNMESNSTCQCNLTSLWLAWFKISGGRQNAHVFKPSRKKAFRQKPKNKQTWGTKMLQALLLGSLQHTPQTSTSMAVIYPCPYLSLSGVIFSRFLSAIFRRSPLIVSRGLVCSCEHQADPSSFFGAAGTVWLLAAWYLPVGWEQQELHVVKWWF